MNHFHNILVGVDLGTQSQPLSGLLSPPNAEAVERGMLLAERCHSQLCFVSVLDASDTMQRLVHDARGEDSNVFDEAHALLGQFVARAKQRGISAESRVLLGKSWLKLIEEVLKHHHDLIILGTRHAGAIDRILFGSTAIKLLRKCPCPVWVTKPSDGLPMTSVLVAHDLGPVGRHALDLGIALARSNDLQLYVIHAIEQLPIGDPTGFGIAHAEARELHDAARDRIHVELELEGSDLQRPPEIRVINGRPEPAILELIEQHAVDLLIMGTIGRAGIRGVLTGNTAERLLPRLQCSMLAIKPDEFQCPIHAE